LPCQSEAYLEEYLKKHPETVINPLEPVAGRVVVSVNFLTGMVDASWGKWLREHFEPVDHIAYSYLVYDISANDVKNMIESEH